jgi:synaptobrevin family protein YKT6
MASGGAAGGGPTTYKVLSISVMRWNNDTEEPILLEAAYNLAEYSFFTRGSVKEFLTFASRTVMKRVTAGSQALDYEGNIVYCVVQPDGLGVIVITDKSYPGRVALKLARETLEDFKALHG